MWWYGNYGIPSALTYGDTSGLFYWLFIYGVLFEHVEKTVTWRSLTQPWERRKIQKHWWMYNQKTHYTFFHLEFLKVLFRHAHLQEKETEAQSETIWPCHAAAAASKLRSPASVLHIELQEPPTPWFHMGNSKSLIERLLFPWSGIKWNKLDTQVSVLV